MQQCYLANGQDACCNFLITSEGKDRRAEFFAQKSPYGTSRAIDNTGQVYPANYLQVGEYMANPFLLTNTLPADIPIFSKACFKKVSAEASQFALFELLFKDITDGFSNESIRVKIQAIPIQDEESQ
jgi:hypothetical protein